MRSGIFPWKLLVQLFCVLVADFTNAGNLDFYQDVEPELPEDITYEQIARYLELQNHKTRQFQRAGMVPILPWTYGEFLDYGRYKEKILEALLENPAILDVLRNEKMKNRDEVVNWRRHYDISNDDNDNGPRPYINVIPLPSGIDGYSSGEIPYTKNVENKKPYYSHGSDYPPKSRLPEIKDYGAEEIEAELPIKFQGKIVESDVNTPEAAEKGENSQTSKQQEPDFTFKFDDLEISERDTFAIRPNNPRYYEDDDATTSAAVNVKTTSHGMKASDLMAERLDEFTEIDEQSNTNNDYGLDVYPMKDKFSFMEVIMPNIRAERDPFTISSARMKNNDVYFIAIVAGCSAAAMFALVLIALTWCRLHRGAKAAADIEYPAYGVTGPNKDISPSGDQRLAHSAQMYHFQHQKQQIIAMENRTAASRDPGSVSEAESDEENEEGDYTVYECPGLASTGEMEVKNPMFHDDPTPATPPQTHKEEDM